MLKKIIILTLVLFAVRSAYTQDCLEIVAKQAVLIDSLQRAINQQNIRWDEYVDNTQSMLRTLSDENRKFRTDLSDLEKFKSQKKSFDNLLKTKSDEIASLKTKLSEYERQIAIIKQEGDAKARVEKERGKTQALSSIVNTYKRPFDDLIKSSSKESVQRDLSLVGNNPEVKPILNDLEIYFNASELLAKKFDLAEVRNAQTQLNQIKQKSIMVADLNERVERYQLFTEGLKETLNKLITLDRLESVAVMSQEIKHKKFDKIMFEFSGYFFKYDFNFEDYPYLTDIVLEIIKLKYPNPDADIVHFLNQL